MDKIFSRRNFLRTGTLASVKVMFAGYGAVTEKQDKNKIIINPNPLCLCEMEL